MMSRARVVLALVVFGRGMAATTTGGVRILLGGGGGGGGQHKLRGGEGPGLTRYIAFT